MGKNSNTIESLFGQNVFNQYVMKTMLPKETYRAFKRVLEQGQPLTAAQADDIAAAMKDWAVEKGATHFTHWFQPMTGFTAEKHDSFIKPTDDGRAMAEFSGKELIKGEPDASSFPSGGLRATFEARGYTAWDISSPAFLKEDEGGLTLCIPTAFCSYTGEALDKKTPLLRSMDALSREAVRVLRLIGNTQVQKVTTTVGAEQEYFLIDREYYEQRPDLIFAGRTLFGAMPPKGQEMEDHYFGSIKDRIAGYMRDLDRELWKLGVSAKTKHNEVAPAQHELAPIFQTTNIAADHNQLTMEMMRKVAIRHDLVCLLHEKPFAGVNGSGKHNNWSMSTDDGQNLLDPGHTPHENVQFFLFLSAVIKAVDEYGDLLRVAAANPGNDHRLGANEAPPAIISVYLGDQLGHILDQIDAGDAKESKRGGILDSGTPMLSTLPKDSSDRNRTSPFAFTGNKFEFRMVPASISISAPNFTLNTIVAEALSGIGDRLEKATDRRAEVKTIIQEIVRKHKRVVFNGNNYAKEWVAEAAKRGLPNISSTVEAFKSIVADKNVALYEKHKVFTRVELEARYEISLENYSKTIRIEALTMVDMARRMIQPSVIRYATFLAESVQTVKAAGADVSVQEGLLKSVSSLGVQFNEKLGALEKAIEKADATHGSSQAHAEAYRDVVFTAMGALREVGDKLETIVDESFWPMPTYGDLLFRV